MPNTPYDELLKLEKRLLELDERGRYQNQFGVLSRGSGLRVLRHDGLEGFSGWRRTSTSEDNPHEDTNGVDELVTSAAVIARLGGTGTPRERFLDGLLDYLRTRPEKNFLIENHHDKGEANYEILRLPYAAANYVRFLANQALQAGNTQPLQRNDVADNDGEMRGESVLLAIAEAPRDRQESTTEKAVEQFPNRASWLKNLMEKYHFTPHDLEKVNGPEHRTVQRILDGEFAQERTLQRLAEALSLVTETKVTLEMIPRD